MFLTNDNQLANFPDIGVLSCVWHRGARSLGLVSRPAPTRNLVHERFEQRAALRQVAAANCTPKQPGVVWSRTGSTKDAGAGNTEHRLACPGSGDTGSGDTGSGDTIHNSGFRGDTGSGDTIHNSGFRGQVPGTPGSGDTIHNSIKANGMADTTPMRRRAYYQVRSAGARPLCVLGSVPAVGFEPTPWFRRRGI